MTTFEELGVDPHISQQLAASGITEPTQIQALTIKDALEGKDLCGKAGTGSGKTLAFAIPAFQNSERAQPNAPISLILVPTRELATQVRDVFLSMAGSSRRGAPRIIAIYGGTSMERQIRDLSRGVDVVVATPGRLIDLMDRRKISLNNVKLVVLDEADRMADMGFLPPVEEILSKTNPNHQTMLFSATLDGDVDSLIRNHMKNPARHEVESKTNTMENMSHYFLVTRDTDKIDILKRVSSSARKTIVFVRTRNNADSLAEHLYKDGIEVDALHGNMRQSARERVLHRFSKGKTSVLIATDVAARGIDVTGLDLVVHYEIPEDHKAYIHRSGRTARAGATGAVVTLLGRSQIRAITGMQKHLGLPQQMFKGNPDEPTLSNIATTDEFIGEVMEIEEFRSRGGSSQGGFSSPRRSYGGNSGFQRSGGSSRGGSGSGSRYGSSSGGSRASGGRSFSNDSDRRPRDSDQDRRRYAGE